MILFFGSVTILNTLCIKGLINNHEDSIYKIYFFSNNQVTDGCNSGNRFISEEKQIEEKYLKRRLNVSEIWNQASKAFDKEKHEDYSEAEKKLKGII